MSEEEPAWRAELVRELSKFDAYPDTWLPAVEPHIQAAEERGRREALKEAAEKIRADSHHPLIQRDGKFYGGMHHAAELIDPDTP